MKNVEAIEQLKTIDSLIRSARGDDARSFLKKINLSKLSEELKISFADLSRRLGLPYLTLKILDPLVKQDGQYKSNITEDVKSLYAISLSRIGAFKESDSLFNSILKSSKKSLILNASAMLDQWNYVKAKAIYEKLLSDFELNEYEESVVKLNKISCLISLEKYERAIHDINKSTINWQKKYPLLYANSLELMAQSYFFLKKYDNAIKTSEYSISLLTTEANYNLFAEKWLVISNGFLKNKIELSWLKFRDKVIINKDYESLRDLDLFESCITKNFSQFLRVYKGTPFPHFKRRAVNMFGRNIKIPSSYSISFGEEVNLHTTIINLNLSNVQCNDTIIQLKGQSIRILNTLLKDYYKPVPLGEIFSTLYPDSYFDIWSSPHRVYMTLYNFKKLTSKILKLKISNKSISIDLTRCKIIFSKKEIFVSLNFKSWLKNQKTPFTRKVLESEMGISRAQALSFINQGLKSKLISRNLSGRHCTYKRLKEIE